MTPIEEGLEGGPSDPITSIGHSIMRTAEASGDALVLLARAIHHMPAALAKRSEILSQMLICGVYSLPVGMLVAAFTGMVLALQTGQALQEYRQGATIGALVAISMCRELGPIWVGVILAARVGSAMAAELGTMRVSEEIDALEVMSIDPAKFLVMPRIIALTLMAPVLTAFADAVGTLGGAIVGKYQVGISYHVYFNWAQKVVTTKDILCGLLIKAPVFGLTIAPVGCALGLRVRPAQGAAGVGAATRNSVVVSLILIIIFNYFLASLIRHI